MKLHNGFQNAYLALRDQTGLKARVSAKYWEMKRAAPHKPIKIFVTGHSLGGALSLVAQYDIWCDENWLPDGQKLFGTISYAPGVQAHNLLVLVPFDGCCTDC